LKEEFGSSQAQVATLDMDLSVAKTMQEKAEVEKEEVVVGKATAIEQQKNAESQYKKLRNKHHHYKAKAKRLLEELSFVPWIRHLGWVLGFN
jgi:chromosome segregation ATPase